MDRRVQLVVRHAEPGRQRALRVQVHEQHPPAVLGQGRTEVDGRRGLADATLLVAHRDDLGRAVRGLRLGLRDRPGWPAGQADARVVGVVGHAEPSLSSTMVADIRASLTG